MSQHYRHLQLADRIEIEKLLDHGHTQSEIARRIGCHRSTIFREIHHRSWLPVRDHANLRPYLRNKLNTHHPKEEIYLAEQAQSHADTYTTRSHQPYRMKQDRLVHWVISKLGNGWTPEEMAGRLPIDHPDDRQMRVSHETVYAWIYAKPEQHRQLWQYLSRGQKRRRRKKGRTCQRERINWRVSIHDRPAGIETRESFGHWEVDSIIGAAHTGGIHTSVERKSRYLCAKTLDRVTAATTLHAQQELYSRFPAHAVASITADNGSEFAHHYKLADTIGVPTYFCDPYSAYQRGTNEHFNGRIRKYLPKGTRFDNLTQEELYEYVTEINNRPRKVLDWYTPAEVFQELCSLEATI